MKRRTLLKSAVALAGAILVKPANAAFVPAAGRRADPWEGLRARVTGRILTPSDADFSDVTQVYAARQRLTPAAVLQAASDDDVSQAIAIAREMQAPLAVRSGGHSYAGYSTCEGGLIIDLSRLRDIRIDPSDHTVTVGGGALVGQIDRATAEIGRATVLGQCASVGIGGLATGGGLGYLMSRHGVAVDNMVGARVLMADGRRVVCDAVSESDLFWAIRGGGGNFGIVTEFTFKTHEIGDVLAGDLIFRADDVTGLLARFAEFCATAPDDLTTICIFVPGPDGKPYFVVQTCFAGDPIEGERALSALRSSPHLVADRIRRQPYLTLQSRIPDTPPTLHVNRSGFFSRLTPDIAADFAEIIKAASGGYTVFLVHHHGAATAPPADATAFSLRTNGFSWGVTGVWRRTEHEDPVTEWVLAAHQRLRRHGSLAYVNTMDVEGKDEVRAAYGPNYRRLSILKRRYDPTNLFRRNQNIEPGSGL